MIVSEKFNFLFGSPVIQRQVSVKHDKKGRLLPHTASRSQSGSGSSTFNTELKITMRNSAEDRLISLRDAAARLSLSQRAVYRLIAKGDLPRPVKVGGATRLYASDIDTYLETLKTNR